MNLEHVRVALWDVRAQWESGVRRLTTTQSSLEEWHVHDQGDAAVHSARLREHVKALKEINATVRVLLDDVDRSLG